MFDVAADAYDRYMGRYAIPLAPRFAEFAGVRQGWRALDVGAGPGALTGVLAQLVGPSSVTAVDPCVFEELICFTPAIVENSRSSGVATADAIVSGSAPGRPADTEMVG